MIEVKPFSLPDVIDWKALQEYQDNIPKMKQNCPEEVQQFIDALAKKLGDFAQIQRYNTYMMGEELILCGVNEVKGEKIDRYTEYPVPMPYMVACDHRAAMYRLYHRKGKQGLIGFVKTKVKGTELERVLEILTVEVFKIHRAEFIQMLAKINASKKLESKIDL